MVIDGRDYKINILMLLMEREAQVTVQTVETLLEGMEEGVIISVLLNGGTNTELRALFSGINSIRYYEVPENLGVAGGRNFLLGTEECRGCDIVMVLDNDVITPLDYLRNLATFLVRHDEAGVVGGAAADINAAGSGALRHEGDRGIWGNSILRIRSAGIKSFALNGFDPDKLYHIGIHPDYHYAYFSARPFLGMFGSRLGAVLGRPRSHHPMLKFNEKWFHIIAGGADKIEVSNVAGCSQAFRRKLLDEIGGLNDIFNPYGYEDVDFCIRAIKAGHKNYIDLGTWLYHCTDSRHIERPLEQMAETLFRGRTLLASLYCPGPVRLRLMMFKLMAVEVAKALMFGPMELPRVALGVWRGYIAGLGLLRRNGPAGRQGG